ncbi:MAG: pseudouridine synthase [Leadbetterella sp.]
MGFRRKLLYTIVHLARVSNNEAKAALTSGNVQVNGVVIYENAIVLEEDEIKLNNEVIKAPKQYSYFKFYKPKGILVNHNPEFGYEFLSLMPQEGLFPVGRLDKDSEGLMILTNDGRIYDKILRKEQQVAKVYHVVTDRIVLDSEIERLANGIDILGQKTLPCIVKRLKPDAFEIVLEQGLNRQIRRMCHKLGLKVVTLKRIQIGDLCLESLESGQSRPIQKSDISQFI